MNVFGVELGSVIHMQNVLSEFMVGGEIVPADKTFWVEELLHPRIAPVNGNCVHMEGVDDFFCTPTSAAGVFEGEVEAVAGEPIDLHLVAVAGR